MLDSNKLNNAAVDDRIECQGSFGTIKYIGEIDGHVGCWLGIDWDDPSRGKHNGSVKTRTYFTAKCDTSGSFLRPEKVQLGQSIITAITSRYGQKDDELTARFHQQQLLSIQQTFNAPLLEFVGFDKITDRQSNYSDLKIINVRLMNVKCIGEPYELKQLCPNLIELDISKNLINSWRLVFQICEELENLNWINVSQNSLKWHDNLEEYNFPKLKTFICGSMDLTWADIMKLCQAFPNLEELVVPKNNITTLDVSSGILQKLKKIDLDGNNIGNWDEICKLGHLPALETMNVDSTCLREIRFKDESKTNLFKRLKWLYLKTNLIDDWESVDELNKLENLEKLSFLKNPIYNHDNTATTQQYIIARIGNLKMLNGTEFKEDRKGAEYDYLKKHGLEWLSVKNDEEKRLTFIKKHRRYCELIEKYGEVEESELKVQVKTIQVTLIEVELVFEDRTITKRLPPSILIQKLIMLVQRLFHLSDRPSLIYTSKEHPDIEIDLDDECKELGIYSIQNGDRILVKT